MLDRGRHHSSRLQGRVWIPGLAGLTLLALAATPTVGVAQESLDVTIGGADSQSETVSTFTFTVTRSSGTDRCQVDYRTVDGTATEGADYSSNTGRLTFEGFTLSHDVVVSITDDSVVELDETFSLEIFDLLSFGVANCVLRTDSLAVTIENDDAAQVTMGDAAVTEGDAGTTNVSVAVTLSGQVDTAISFGVGTSDDTATAPADYSSFGTTVIFSALDSGSQNVDLSIVGETEFEPDEDFTLDVGATSFAGRDVTVVDGSGTITILNDDALPVPNVSFWGLAVLAVALAATGAWRLSIHHSRS